MPNALTRISLLVAVLGFAGAAQATDIAGTITSTVTITKNSRLVGDVSCTMTTTPAQPCIQFGASGITLNLNGHIITGNGSQTSCTYTAGQHGIAVPAGFNNVSIQGPGIVRRFLDTSILVTGNNSSVNGVTVLSSCIEAIRVEGTQNQITENSLDLASFGFPGREAVIFVSGFVTSAGSNFISKNEVNGGAYGIFVGESGAPSNNNVITLNNASVNNFTGIAILPGSSGNKIIANQALGNASPTFAYDIVDENSPGTNTFYANLCETSSVGPSIPGANICGLPNISGHQPPNQEEEH
jgi:hypothetical protein